MFNNKLIKETDSGKYIILLERMWLVENDKENDGYTPRPVPNKYFKFVFLGSINEYLKTDYNIKKYVNKNKFAIQITYPYLGTDDSKLGKEVISLYLVKHDDSVVHYQRIWEEL
jgi:hypothetical protein